VPRVVADGDIVLSNVGYIGDPRVLRLIDHDVIAAPVRVAPAPQWADDPKANTETDAGAEDEPGVDELRWRRNVDRWIILMGPCAVDLGGVVDGDIQYRWLGRLDDDVGPLANDPDLLARAETARRERAITQELDPRHRLHLLVGKGGAECLGPVKMLGQHRDNLRKGDQGFDARIPG
jgi:hypothetical protein